MPSVMQQRTRMASSRTGMNGRILLLRLAREPLRRRLSRRFFLRRSLEYQVARAVPGQSLVAVAMELDGLRVLREIEAVVVRLRHRARDAGIHARLLVDHRAAGDLPRAAALLEEIQRHAPGLEVELVAVHEPALVQHQVELVDRAM